MHRGLLARRLPFYQARSESRKARESDASPCSYGILAGQSGLIPQRHMDMVFIILPAYNEEEALPPLLESIAALRPALPDLRVVVVDDGSADATAQVVRAFVERYPWVGLVQHERNRGLGEALRTGLQAALAEAADGDVLVTLDADNTQPPEAIPALVGRLNEGCDVVIASRFRRGARVYGVPLLRRLYSRAMSLLFRVAFPIPGVRDYSCGFRAYRAEVLRHAQAAYGERFITERGFAATAEILFQLARLGNVRFGEVPFTLRYDRKPTATKMPVAKTIRETLAVAWRTRVSNRREHP